MVAKVRRRAAQAVWRCFGWSESPCVVWFRSWYASREGQSEKLLRTNDIAAVPRKYSNTGALIDGAPFTIYILPPVIIVGAGTTGSSMGRRARVTGAFCCRPRRWIGLPVLATIGSTVLTGASFVVPAPVVQRAEGEIDEKSA